MITCYRLNDSYYFDIIRHLTLFLWKLKYMGIYFMYNIHVLYKNNSQNQINDNLIHI